MTRAFAQRAPALIQLLRSPYLTFTRQLPADARALLLALLLDAHQVHRLGGQPVLRLSASELATELGLPRRRLTKLLAALEAAGAVAWRPGSGGRDGELSVLAYPHLVRDGRREMGDGFVQLLIHELEAERRRLGFDAWALLVGLLIAVPWVGQRLQASGRHMSGLLGTSWRGLLRHVGQLAEAGLVTYSAGARPRSEVAIEVAAYRRLVRVTLDGCREKARGVRRDGAGTATETRGGPGLSRPIDKKRLTTETLSLRPSTLEVGEPPMSASAELEAAPLSAPTSQGKAGAEQQPDQQATEPDARLRVALELASALQTAGITHDLTERHNRPGLRALSRRLGELTTGGWETDALRDELLDGLHGARSALAVLLHRARALPTNPGAEPSAADEAEAVARKQRQRRLTAAQAHVTNLLAAEVDLSDVLGALERYRRQDADAYESAVGELLRLRPEATALLDGWSVAS